VSYVCFECGSRYEEFSRFCPICLQFDSFLSEPKGGKVFFQQRERRVLTAKELARKKVAGKIIEGFEFLGELPSKWTILLWGSPGAGKTTFALRLSAALGEKTLFCASEQGYSDSLSKILVDWEIRTDRILISDARNLRELRQDIEEFLPSLLVVDSVNVLGGTLTVDKNIWIVQSTKDGRFRGEQTLAHDVDVMLKIDRERIEITKNRFGDTKEVFYG